MSSKQRRSRLRSVCKELQEYAAHFKALSQEVCALADVHEKHLGTLEEKLDRWSQLQTVCQEQATRLSLAEQELSALRGQCREQAVQLEQTRHEWERTKARLSELENAAAREEPQAIVSKVVELEGVIELEGIIEKLREQCNHLQSSLSAEQRQSLEQRAEWMEEIKMLRQALETMRREQLDVPPAPQSGAEPMRAPMGHDAHEKAAAAERPYAAGQAGQKRKSGNTAARQEKPSDALLDSVLNQFASLRGHPSIAPAYRRSKR